MKILLLLIWYFALGRDLYSFNAESSCEALRKYYVETGIKVSQCLSVDQLPNGRVEQHSTGDNSPNVVSPKGGVNITIDGKKTK